MVIPRGCCSLIFMVLFHIFHYTVYFHFFSQLLSFNFCLRVGPVADLKIFTHDLFISYLPSTHVLLSYVKVGLERKLCLLTFTSHSLFKILVIYPFNLLYLCIFSSKSIFICLKQLKEFISSVILFYYCFYPPYVFRSIAISSVLFVDIFISYIFNTLFKLFMFCCKFSSLSARST